MARTWKRSGEKVAWVQVSRRDIYAKIRSGFADSFTLLTSDSFTDAPYSKRFLPTFLKQAF